MHVSQYHKHELLFDGTAGGASGSANERVDFHISELPRSLQDNGTIVGAGSREITLNNRTVGSGDDRSSS